MAEKSRIVPEVTMSASEVRQHFSEVVNRVARGEDRVLVEKHGSPAVGLVSMADLHRLRNLEDELQRRRDLVERIRARFDSVPDDEIERETQRILEELRQERRSARTKAAS